MSQAKVEDRLPAWLPLAATLVATLASLLLAYSLAMAKTGDTFIFGLDDAYIHLSMARNFSASGVWGLTASQPASASSSPLWTYLLSLLCRLPVDPVLIPLLLNLVLAVLAARTVFRLVPFGNPWAKAGAAALVVFALPAAAIFLEGMENLLHAFLTLVFVAGLVMLRGQRASWKVLLGFAVIGLLMTMTRYESVFLFLLPAAWGLYRREPILLAPMVGGLVGVVVFGLISVRAGMPFVPNTLLLKSDVGEAQGIGGFLSAMALRIKLNLVEAPTVMAVGVTGVFALLTLWKTSPRTHLVAASAILALVLHVAFSFTRQLFRYEAYVVAAMAMGVLFSFLKGNSRPTDLGRLAIGLFGVALFARGALAVMQAPQAVQNIHDQQYQMARFFGAAYPGKTIALNDIGAVSYYTDCRIVDLYGLANKEVLDLKRKKQFNTQAIAEILRKENVDAAAIFPGWFDQYGGLPETLLPAALWRMDEPNLVCAWDRVTFAAPGNRLQPLVASLHAFRPNLPKTVKVSYFQLAAQP